MLRQYWSKGAQRLAVVGIVAFLSMALSCESEKSPAERKAELAKINCSSKPELVARYPGVCISKFVENAKPAVIAGFVRNQELTKSILEKDAARDPAANMKAFLASQRSDVVSLIEVRSLSKGTFKVEFEDNLTTRGAGDILIDAMPDGLVASGGSEDGLFDLFLYVKREDKLDVMKTEIVIDGGKSVGVSFVDSVGADKVHYVYLMSHDGLHGIGGFFKRLAKTTIEAAKVERVIMVK